MNSVELLFNLCLSSGPSGAEAPVMAQVDNYVRPLADEVYYDQLGSLTALFKSGRKDARLVLFDAHLDEVSLTVTADCGGGFYRFKTIGHDPRVLPGASVTLLFPSGNISGVITALPPHILPPAQMEKAYDIADLFIDIGILSDTPVIPIGTRALLDGRAVNLQGSTVTAPALDDRAGYVCLLRAVELLMENGRPPCDIALVGSVMEEFGGMGALTSANRLQPDLAVVVDVTHARTPDASSEDTFKLRSGPTIGLGPNLDRHFAKRLEALANRRAIPYSFEVMEGPTGTNAWPIQISGRGVPCALLSIPVRYMHTPQEVMSMDDLESTARLIAAFIEDYAGGEAV